VAATRACDPKAVPVELVLDRPRVEAELPEPRLVAGLAEGRNVPRHQPLGRLIEMVPVEVSHEHGVEVADDLLGGHRQGHERVAQRRFGVPHGRPCAGLVQRGVDEHPAPVELEEQCRVADERQAHDRNGTRLAW
jgi:hypothetical protein